MSTKLNYSKIIQTIVGWVSLLVQLYLTLLEISCSYQHLILANI